MEKSVKVLKSLSDENRLRIVIMLKERPMCVCEINKVLNIAMSTISAHLKTLKYAEVIKDKKDGRWITYSLNEENKCITAVIDNLLKCISDDEQIKKDLMLISNLKREDCTLC